jgi:hypothetical protein
MKTDAQLKDDVIEELRWDPQISDADAIGVGVKDGAMILSGHVPNYAEKMAAAQAAERVNGVQAVGSDLKVEHPGRPGMTWASPRPSRTSWSGTCRCLRTGCTPRWNTAGSRSTAISIRTTSAARWSRWSAA